jgi:hypothetical protein
VPATLAPAYHQALTPCTPSRLTQAMVCMHRPATVPTEEVDMGVEGAVSAVVEAADTAVAVDTAAAMGMAAAAELRVAGVARDVVVATAEGHHWLAEAAAAMVGVVAPTRLRLASLFNASVAFQR